MEKGKIKYGVDAPLVPITCISVGIIVLGFWFPSHGYLFAWITFIYGLSMIIGRIIFLHTSLRGKFLVWNKIIEGLNISKNSQILDLGCGHGTVLIKFAQKIDDSGKAIGVDLWRNVDQSNNSSVATEKNLKLANVDQRTDLITADMAELPLKDASFDFVVSSMAFHNIKPRQQREKALCEACRVLKNGGKLIIVDTGNNFKEYRKTLEEQKLIHIKLTVAGFNGWWTG